MGYYRGIGGDLQNLPCAVESDLRRYMREQDRDDRYERAIENAQCALLDNRNDFLDAIVDVIDTLHYHDHKPLPELAAHSVRLQQKQKIALAAVDALREVYRMKLDRKPMTPAESAIAELLAFEVEPWIEREAEASTEDDGADDADMHYERMRERGL